MLKSKGARFLKLTPFTLAMNLTIIIIPHIFQALKNLKTIDNLLSLSIQVC